MDNIFSKGDRYIHFREDGSTDTGTITEVSISQVSDKAGFCYEVINLINQDNKVLPLFQMKGRIHKLRHIMNDSERERFSKGEYMNPYPTRHE